MKVTDFRISRLWVEGVPRQMIEDCGRFGRLVRRSDYAKLFNALLDAGDDLLKVPWPQERGKYPIHNRYWYAYFIRDLQNHLQSDAGEQAWSAVVPLQRKNPLVRIAWSRRSFVEAWYYPHAVATAVTARFEGTFDPAGMEAAANELLGNALELEWTDQSAGRPTSLPIDRLAETILEVLRSEAFGADGGGASAHTIFTITQAVAEPGDDASAAVPFVEKALSLVGSDPDLKIAADRAVYVVPRGRVIWRRDRALADSGHWHTLGCMHRNVGVATMQVASLLRAAEMLASAYDEGHGALPARIEAYARRVAGLIGRIYGGRETYAAPFLRDQISDAKAHGRLDDLRMQLGMEALK